VNRVLLSALGSASARERREEGGNDESTSPMHDVQSGTVGLGRSSLQCVCVCVPAICARVRVDQKKSCCRAASGVILFLGSRVRHCVMRSASLLTQAISF